MGLYSSWFFIQSYQYNFSVCEYIYKMLSSQYWQLMMKYRRVMIVTAVKPETMNLTTDKRSVVFIYEQ